MKKINILVILVLCIGLFTACSNEASGTTEATEGNSGGESNKLEDIKVGYNPGTGNILTFIAIEKGIDKEEGIEMELVPFTNSTDALTSLQSKKIDVAVSFGTAAPLTY